MVPGPIALIVPRDEIAEGVSEEELRSHMLTLSLGFFFSILEDGLEQRSAVP
jgi:hypothetical protein